MPRRVNGQPFTCENGRYRTMVEKGLPHGDGEAGGSVLPRHVVESSDGATLWLEYVTDAHGDEKWPSQPMWLMWYSKTGMPTISQSATFDATQAHAIITGLGLAALEHRDAGKR